MAGIDYYIYPGQTVTGLVVSVGDTLTDFGTVSGGTIYGTGAVESATYDKSGGEIAGGTIYGTVQDGSMVSGSTIYGIVNVGYGEIVGGTIYGSAIAYDGRVFGSTVGSGGTLDLF